MKAFLLLGMVLVFGIVLAGCKEEGQPVNPAAEAPLVEPALLYNRADYPEEIVITEHGLIGYWENTPFSADTLKAAFPDFDIIAATDGSEGQSWDVFHVTKGNIKFVQVDSDFLGNVGKVSTSSPLVGIDTGHKVGMTFTAIFPDFSNPVCYPGLEELSGMVLCEAPDRTQIYYIFAGTWDGPDGRIPPPEVMATWAIDSIFWTSR